MDSKQNALRLLSLKWSFFAVGLITLALLGRSLVGFTIAQQPELIPPVYSGLPDRPTVDADSFIPPSLDPKSDPLFQEIQKMILNGGRATGGANGSDQLPANGMGEVAVSSARWHAVELTLNAARLLEKDLFDCLLRSDLDEATKTQRTIKALRSQAVQLLQ